MVNSRISYFVHFLVGALFLSAYCGRAQDISFGTDIDPVRQVKESAKLAKNTRIIELGTTGEGRDRHLAYPFPEAGKDMGFRICVPSSWDGKSPLPMVVFLHGGWCDENSYLDDNDKFLVKTADKFGYLLVSPSGGTEAYGNYLKLPAGFGKDAEARKCLSEVTPERRAEQTISEKDVINVIEIALSLYPVDRKAMFLAGHSMGGGGTWYIGGKYSGYWRAIAPMSGPFVIKDGYPWENLAKMPIFVTEGTKAFPSVQSSRDLRDYLTENGFDVKYEEVDLDHMGMVPATLPDIFRWFDEIRNK